MQLPGRLKDTTLGDLLGALHRARATGALELIELAGLHAGKCHRITFRDGQITGIDGPSPAPHLGEILGVEVQARRRRTESDYTRIGEYLLDAGLVSRTELRSGLRRQLQVRLDFLFSLSDAELRFRTPRPEVGDPTAPDPLDKSEFLAGRPRARARVEDAPSGRREPAIGERSARHADALRVLGLPPTATRADIQRAFRALAQGAHPDRHPRANAREKVELLRRFAELSRAYHLLVG